MAEARESIAHVRFLLCTYGGYRREFLTRHYATNDAWTSGSGHRLESIRGTSEYDTHTAAGLVRSGRYITLSKQASGGREPHIWTNWVS